MDNNDIQDSKIFLKFFFFLFLTLFCLGFADEFNYDTFVYDIIQNDQSTDSDLFIHLEDIFGGIRSFRAFLKLVLKYFLI